MESNFAPIVVLLLLASCSIDVEPSLGEMGPTHRRVECKSTVLYHPSSRQWIRPQENPYKIDNILRAYNNLLSKDFSPEDISEPTPTHLCMRIYPRDEKEQWTIEHMRQISISYIPFDYVALTEKEVSLLGNMKEDLLQLEDTRYFVSNEAFDSSNSHVGQEILSLPVIYAAWPKDLPLPNDLEYEIDYEAFHPDYYSSNSQIQKFVRMIESEAIRLVVNTESTTGTTNPYGPRRGYVRYYDSFMHSLVPQINLKQRFQLGSVICEVYTDSTGCFQSPMALPASASYLHIFQTDDWKITDSTSTIPIIVNNGTLGGIWGPDSLINVTPTDSVSLAYDIHPAVNYYFNGNHDVTRGFLNSGIRIVSMQRFDDEANGYFYPGDFHVEIFRNNSTNPARFYGTIFHELGHFSHRANVVNTFYYATHPLIKESFASCVGYYLTNNYYVSLGYVFPSSNRNISGQARQAWKSTESSVYSPLFVDLIDNYNQNSYFSSYNYDPIYGVPFTYIWNTTINSQNWNDLSTRLHSISGPGITNGNILLFLAPYSIWFSNNQ